MAISSLGLGSGIDANSIVSQLGAIERQPLQQLKSKASTLQSQLSLYGKIKSQASSLGDAAADLMLSSAWSAPKATSSNPNAVGVTVNTGAAAASVSLEVSNLARSQSAATKAMPAGVAVGASGGTLSIQLGSWTGNSFSPGASSAVSVNVEPTDTMVSLASKINSANAGVSASVVMDGGKERLMVRSNTTGESSGFRIDSAGDAALEMFGVTNSTATSGTDTGMFISQSALDASYKLNGVSLKSANNKINDALPGVNLSLSQVTTTPVEITVENDLDAVKNKIKAVVDAYNTLNQTLADATKYDAGTKTAGALQADSLTLNMQMALRSMMSSQSSGSSAFKLLSDVGIERNTDGSYKINSKKMTDAIANLPELKKVFTTDNSNSSTNGFALKIRDFARGLVSADGRITNRTAGIQTSIKKNSEDQDRVNQRADRVEENLRRQYSALDNKMSQMGGLSSYVSSQIAQWNKSS
jgi:flagellar hook-associated protein 2